MQSFPLQGASGLTGAGAARRLLRPPEAIPGPQRRVLLLVGLASFLAAYDLNIFGLAATQVLGSFGLGENMTGPSIAAFRLGVIGSLVLCALADAAGRRRLLLITVTGMGLSTLGTAFALDYQTFLIAQFFVRVFAYADDMICIVVVAEEFSEKSRGWAIGVLGALSALGGGMSVVVFSLVNVLPFGWRAIYFIGAVPLLVLALLRRRLTETRRFTEQVAEAGGRQSVLQGWRPIVSLIRAYPGRLALLVLAVVPFAWSVGPATTLMPTFLQQVRALAPWQVSAVILLVGVIGLVGAMLIGRLGDIYGRRRTLGACVLMTAGGYAALYAFDSPWVLFPAALFGIFGSVAAGVQLEALGAELFPTAYRATASSIRFMAQILVGAVSLLLHGFYFSPMMGFGEAVLFLLIPMPLALLPLFFLPETAQRTLEDIAERK